MYKIYYGKCYRPVCTEGRVGSGLSWRIKLINVKEVLNLVLSLTIVTCLPLLITNRRRPENIDDTRVCQALRKFRRMLHDWTWEVHFPSLAPTYMYINAEENLSLPLYFIFFLSIAVLRRRMNEKALATRHIPLWGYKTLCSVLTPSLWAINRVGLHLCRRCF